MTALFNALLNAGCNVGVFNFDDAWLDVGGPEDFRRAQGWS
jgi:hypothetical protein